MNLTFRQLEVLGNTDDQWRSSKEIRGALHLTVQHAAGILGALRYHGLVESRVTDKGPLRAEWRITEFGKSTLEEARNV